MRKIAIIQGALPHYREHFFKKISMSNHIDFFVFEKPDPIRQGLNNIKLEKTNYIKLFSIGKFKFYHLFKVKNYDLIILPLESSLISNLYFLIFHRSKTVLWGHGINLRRKSIFPPYYYFLLLLSNGAIFYTSKEFKYWSKRFPAKPMGYLNNTLHKNLDYYNSLPTSNSILRKNLKLKNITFVY